MFADPIPARLYAPDGLHVLMLGVVGEDILYVSATGELGLYKHESFYTDWRYDPEQNVWYDVERPIAPTENEGTMADSLIASEDDPIGGSE